MPSMPRSQKLWTFVRRSAKTVGVVSERLSKTLMSPLFSATNTRPSEANRITVGLVSPLKTVVSTKPAGTTPADAVSGPGGDTALGAKSAAVANNAADATSRSNPRFGQRCRTRPSPVSPLEPTYPVGGE